MLKICSIHKVNHLLQINVVGYYHYISKVFVLYVFINMPSKGELCGLKAKLLDPFKYLMLHRIGFSLTLTFIQNPMLGIHVTFVGLFHSSFLPCMQKVGLKMGIQIHSVSLGCVLYAFGLSCGMVLHEIWDYSMAS